MEQPISKDLTGMLVNKQFKLHRKLGSGAFGEIYLASNINPNSKFPSKEVAIKIEKSDSKHPQIAFETKLYLYLNQHQTNLNVSKGIPKVYSCISEMGYNFMVMELLGKSLEDLFTNINRRFSLRTVALLAIQMIDSVEFLHSKQFIHRDIKPDNFLMGIDTNSHKVYMVDYGLAKRYISKEGHIPYKENKSLTGTARYASINTHLGIEQSRRDDLEALGYVLMYFLRGYLPWQNLRASTQKEKYERIMEKKLATSTETLCKGHPEEFSTYMNYCKNLKFDEKPDYAYLKGLFQDILVKNQFELQYVYDWDDENIMDKKISFSLEPKPTNPQTNKEFVIFHQKKHSEILNENLQKPIGNYFNNTSKQSNIQVQGNNSTLQERLPFINKSINQQAQDLIQQLQKHQNQIQSRSFHQPPRNSTQMQRVSISQNPQDNTINQSTVIQSLNQVLIPGKTVSMHSIQNPNLQDGLNFLLSKQKKSTQISQNALYKTLYGSKPNSQEKNLRKGRQLKNSKKFMISYKNSTQLSQQQSFH